MSDEKITELNAKFEQTNSFLGNLLNQERQSSQQNHRSLLVFVSIISIVFVAFQVFNSMNVLSFIEENTDRTRRIAEDAERRIARALEDTEPFSSEITTLEGKSSGIIFLEGFVYIEENLRKPKYGVELLGNFRIAINGPSGNLIGIQHKYEGNILNYISRYPEPQEEEVAEINDISYRRFKTGIYSPQGKTTSIIVSKDAPTSSHVSVRFSVRDCESAIDIINEMMNKKDLGRIYIKPVFLRIAEPTKFWEFSVRIQHKMIMPCDEMAAIKR